MSLETRIDDDWKAAMKAGEKARKDALSLLRAAIKQKRVDDKVEIDRRGGGRGDREDAQAAQGFDHPVRSRQRQDLADAENSRPVLAGYMPQGLSAAEVAAIVCRRRRRIRRQRPGRHGQGHRPGQAPGRRPRRHGRSLEAGQGETGRRLMRGIMPA
jgi:uncharacterized protein YqeY